MKSTWAKSFTPELFLSFKNYNKATFIKDLMAGLIVGIVALPLAIAFGIASGVSPEKGIITAIIGGFLVSFFGGSKVQIGGPTGAFVVIVFGIIQQFGFTGLAVATVMAGLMLLLIGFLRLGPIIRFIPYPIIVGFTSGIAVTIFTTQIKDFFGLQIEKIPGDFLGKWSLYLEDFATLDGATVAVGMATMIIVFLFPKINKKIPGSLVAIILTTLAIYLLRQWGGLISVETIGDRFTFSSSLPQPQGFDTPIDIPLIQKLLPSAFTIAMLGAIESLLSASVADGMINSKHNSNAELVAQGIANVVVPFFGGIPVTGAIARTMTNINNGGKTPVSGLVHAVVLLIIMLFLGPLTAYIPMACLAGILVVVSYNMGDWKSFVSISRGSRGDAVVLFITFILTVLLDLTVAIEIGMIIAMLLFVRRVYKSSEVIMQTDLISPDNETSLAGTQPQDEVLHLSHGIEVFEIQGPFFFGIANKFDEVTQLVGNKPQVRILRMRRVPFMDSTGIRNLRIMVAHSQKADIHLILSGVTPQVQTTLQQSGLTELIGEENICPHIRIAAERAEAWVAAHPM